MNSQNTSKRRLRIVIAAVLAMLAVVVNHTYQSYKITQAVSAVRSIAAALAFHFGENSSEALFAVAGEEMKEIPVELTRQLVRDASVHYPLDLPRGAEGVVDPWGQPFRIWVSLSTNDGVSLQVFSAGRDRFPGTADDITSDTVRIRK